MRDYKLVVLGAGGVGKSCLTVQFVQGVYLDSYDPTIEDSYRKTFELDNKIFDLEILDTAGVAQFTAMRELYIKSGMGFLLVYSVTDKQSLEELMQLREQVLRIKDSSKVPMVLVGNKADLKNERVISVEDGIEVSSKWGKVPFYETSALLRSNVDEIFVDLVRQIMRDEIESVTNNTISHNPNTLGSANLLNSEHPSSVRQTNSVQNLQKRKPSLQALKQNSVTSPKRMASHATLKTSNLATTVEKPTTNNNTSNSNTQKSKAPSSAKKPQQSSNAPKKVATSAPIKKKKKKSSACNIL